MNQLKFIVIIIILLTISCEKDQPFPDGIVGTWRVAKVYTFGRYYIPQNPTVRVFTEEGDQISGNQLFFDYNSNSKDTCKFKVVDSDPKIYGDNWKNLILYGDDWKVSNQYVWLNQDTLKIRHSDGFEYYDEYYHRIKTQEYHKLVFNVDPELKSDFTGTAFKAAISGKWESVFELKGQENVKYLELSENHTARIIFTKEFSENICTGNYTVDFLRPPEEDWVTFAIITITTSTDSVVLSRVNFGLHNFFSSDYSFLRIDGSPYGVLAKIN